MTTPATRAARAALDWTDARVAVSRGGRRWLDAIFPDHWSFLLGEIALYSFLILLVSGIFLSLYYVPSQHMVVYHGNYKPLDGQRMTEAYESVLNISFKVRGGLLMRQMHHWASLIFIGALCVHMARVFFTGAFRRPRELNWHIGITLLLLAFLNGYLGESLTNDLISGTGVIIGWSITVSIPIFGSQLAYLIFGGRYPGTVYMERFFFLHVFVFGILLTAFIGLHVWLVLRAQHTQFRHHGATEDNVVGTPLWPGYLTRSIGLLALVLGILFFLSAIFQIDPVWLYGPYQSVRSTDAAQPDWYIGILEGALRLFPNWESNLSGHMLAEQFWPGVCFPVVTFVTLYAYPHLEAWLRHDHSPHNILERPRDHPLRTGFGLAFLTFYFVLVLAAGDDVLSHWLRVPIEDVVWYFRVGNFAAPAIVFLVTYRICKELRERPRSSVADHDLVVTRRRDGAYEEVYSAEVARSSSRRLPRRLES